jgi:hypothetical protein
VVDITKLAFYKGFRSLKETSPGACKPLWGHVHPGQVDVDKMEICMSPSHLLTQFNSPLAVVRLSSHQPKLKRTQEGDRGHEFSDWLLLAESTFQIWVDPIYKDNFYKELKKFRTVHPAESPLVSTYGSALVPMTLLVHCLRNVHCRTIRYKAYGQKLPLCPPFMRTEPSQHVHHLSHLNEWDIGITYRSPLIFLFKPALGASKNMSTFPMSVPSSVDHGSVKVDITWGDTHYKVKIYPRLVHVIKAFNSRLQGEPLSTMRGVRRRTKAATQMVHLLSTIPEKDLGGFRIEVSVQAPTLSIAKQWVDNTPLLDVHFWQDPWGQGTVGHKVDILIAIKSDFLNNTRWVIQRAMSSTILTGRDIVSPTKLQKQVVGDILCSLGWNAGKYKATKSLDPKAWWTGYTQQVQHVPQSGPPMSTTDIQMGQVLDHLTRSFQGRDKVKQLVALIRETIGHVPCPLEFVHQVKLNGWTPLRMKCKDCGTNLNAGACYLLFSQLVAEGHVPPGVIGMGTPSTQSRDNFLVSLAFVCGWYHLY